ncbi:MAG: Zn-ribbon domain-containing OB-fold protein [Patescibacteria group bacterium]
MFNPVKNWRRQSSLKHTLNKQGVIITCTTIYTANAKMQSQTPYAVALIEMEDGERHYGQVVDCKPEEVEVGMKVRSTLRIYSFGETTEDVITYGMKFVLLP